LWQWALAEFCCGEICLRNNSPNQLLVAEKGFPSLTADYFFIYRLHNLIAMAPFFKLRFLHSVRAPSTASLKTAVIILHLTCGTAALRAAFSTPEQNPAFGVLP
jgi:hypothetical protein